MPSEAPSIRTIMAHGFHADHELSAGNVFPIAEYYLPDYDGDNPFNEKVSGTNHSGPMLRPSISSLDVLMQSHHSAIAEHAPEVPQEKWHDAAEKLKLMPPNTVRYVPRTPTSPATPQLPAELQVLTPRQASLWGSPSPTAAVPCDMNTVPTAGTFEDGAANAPAALPDSPAAPKIIPGSSMSIVQAITTKSAQTSMTPGHVSETSMPSRALSGVVLERGNHDQYPNRGVRRTSKENWARQDVGSLRRTSSLKGLGRVSTMDALEKDFFAISGTGDDAHERPVSALVLSSNRASAEPDLTGSVARELETMRIKRQDKTRARKLRDLQRSRQSMDEVVRPQIHQSIGIVGSGQLCRAAGCWPQGKATILPPPCSDVDEVKNDSHPRLRSQRMGPTSDPEHPALRDQSESGQESSQSSSTSSTRRTLSVVVEATTPHQLQQKSSPLSSISRSLHEDPVAIDSATLHHFNPLPGHVNHWNSTACTFASKALPAIPVASHSNIAPASADSITDFPKMRITRPPNHLPVTKWQPTIGAWPVTIHSEPNSMSRPVRRTPPRTVNCSTSVPIETPATQELRDTNARMAELEHKVQMLAASLAAVLNPESRNDVSCARGDIGVKPLPETSASARDVSSTPRTVKSHSPSRIPVSVLGAAHRNGQPPAGQQPIDQCAGCIPDTPTAEPASYPPTVVGERSGQQQADGIKPANMGADLAAVALQLLKISRSLGVQDRGMAVSF